MSRALSANSAAEVGLPVTRPLYLVQFDFSTVLRFSSREEVSYDGLTWTAASLKVDLASGRLSLFNDALAYTDDFLAGVSGEHVSIWKLYGNGPWSSGDAEPVFDGEVGDISVGASIGVRLRAVTARRLPRLYVTPPTFNHLPPDGLQILTPSGVFILERK